MSEGFKRLVEITKRLRAPDGCPWDKKQTYDSLCPHIVEEAHELVDALQRRDVDGYNHVVEECGDLALQFVFIGCLGEEDGQFTIDDIFNSVCEKLIRRHPHVFGDAEAKDEAGALAQWEKIKAKERAADNRAGLLSGVPRGLPASVKAYRIQSKAASVGFDWKKGDQEVVFDKINEELDEVRSAMKGEKSHLEEELGDLMFAVINLARRLNIDPDSALARSNNKFMSRFAYIEEQVQKLGKEVSDLPLSELDQFWDEAKRAE